MKASEKGPQDEKAAHAMDWALRAARIPWPSMATGHQLGLVEEIRDIFRSHCIATLEANENALQASYALAFKTAFVDFAQAFPGTARSAPTAGRAARHPTAYEAHHGYTEVCDSLNEPEYSMNEEGDARAIAPRASLCTPLHTRRNVYSPWPWTGSTSRNTAGFFRSFCPPPSLP